MPACWRARMRRAKGMIATLMMSQGVPMLLAGDEFGQSQGGNNNAYCQDTEIAWLDWDNAREDLIAAVASIVGLRRALDGLISPRFERADNDGTFHGVTWLHPEGREMTEDDWADDGLFCMAKEVDFAEGDKVIILLNAGDDATFTLPEGDWHLRLDTARDEVACDETVSGRRAVAWQSVQVLTRASG